MLHALGKTIEGSGLKKKHVNAEGVFMDLQTWYSDNVKPLETPDDLGEFAQFALVYVKHVDTLLNLIRHSEVLF